MRKTEMLKCWSLVFAVLVGLAPPVFAATSDGIGVATAVNPDATGTPPGSRTRTITVGLGMVRDELLRTGPVGRTQLLFQDGSAMIIGPSSELVLDTFVYDPEEKTGEIVINATQGLFRFVGGKISKKRPVVFKTRHATIGIRGGVVLILATKAETKVTLLFGTLEITAGGVTKVLERAGFQVTIIDPDEPPGAALPVESAVLINSLTELEGVLGSDGGIANPPSDETIEGTQIGALTSSSDPSSAGTQPADQSGNLSSVEELVLLGTQNQAVDTTAAGIPSTTTTTTTTTTVTTSTILNTTLPGRVIYATSPTSLGTDSASLSLNLGFADGSVSGLPGSFSGGAFAANIATGSFTATATSNPFGGGTLTGTGKVTSDQQFLYYNLADSANGSKIIGWAGVPTPTSVFPTTGTAKYTLQADFILDSGVPFVRGGTSGLTTSAYIDWALKDFFASTVSIVGSGSSQKSYGGVLVGRISGTSDASTAAIDGEFRGDALNEASSIYKIFNGSVDTQRAASGTDGNSFSSGTAFYGGTHPSYFVLGADGGAEENSITSGSGNVTTTYYPNVIAEVSDTDLSTTKTSRTLSAYAAGPALIFDASGNLTMSVLLEDSDVGGGGNSGGSSSITLNASTGAISATINTKDLENEQTSGAVLLFGGDSNEQRRAFIDDSHFAVIEKGNSEGSQTITNVMTEISSDALYLTTASDVQTSDFLPSGVSFCTCTYLNWGFWGGILENSTSAALNPGYDAVVNLGTWIAGEVAVTMPNSGTASYEGHLIGSVQTTNDLYLAAGKYTQSVNFGTGTTDITASSFDGVTYSKVGAAFSGSTFSTFTVASGRKMTVNGAFFQGGGDQTQAVGGNFRVVEDGEDPSDSNYNASGIFAADKQ